MALEATNEELRPEDLVFNGRLPVTPAAVVTQPPYPWRRGRYYGEVKFERAGAESAHDPFEIAFTIERKWRDKVLFYKDLHQTITPTKRPATCFRATTDCSLPLKKSREVTLTFDPTLASTPTQLDAIRLQIKRRPSRRRSL